MTILTLAVLLRSPIKELIEGSVEANAGPNPALVDEQAAESLAAKNDAVLRPRPPEFPVRRETDPASRPLPPPAYAGALIFERSIGELTALADRILVADVLAVKSQLSADGGAITTDVELAVNRVFKGPAATQLTLTLPGGQVGGRLLLVGGVPIFNPGERVLLFLDDNSPFAIAGMWQGKYSLFGSHAIQPESGQMITITTLEQEISQSLAAPVQIDPAPELIHSDFTISCPGWSPFETPIAHYVNPDNPGSGAPAGAAFVRLVYEALNAWQALPDAWITLQVAGTTSRNATDHFDGNHDVAWANLSGSTLGVNFCATSFGQRVDSDTLFDNSNQSWSLTAEAGKIDLPAVAEHEFGHGIGIGHSDQPCDGSAFTPLMCAFISTGARKTILADDANAATFLYPLSGSPPAAPSNLMVTPAIGSNTLNWSDNAFDEHAFEIQRAVDSCGAAFKAVATVSANVTSYIDTDYGAGLSGAYCYRVKALNQGGDSGFSNSQLANALTVSKYLVSTNVVTAGARITYTIEIQNNSTQAVTDITVSDSIPSNSTYVPNSAEATPNIGNLSGFPPTTPSFTLSSSGTVIITYAVEVSNDAERGDLLINTATVSAPILSQATQATSITIVDPLTFHLPFILQNN